MRFDRPRPEQLHSAWIEAFADYYTNTAEISRGFDCFELACTAIPEAVTSSKCIRRIDCSEVEMLVGEIDFEPSWETSFAAMCRIPEDIVLLGAFEGSVCLGATAYYPRLRWLMGTVVRRDHRRQGIATGLLIAMARYFPEQNGPILLINVDSSDCATRALATKFGFNPEISQYEMELRFSSTGPSQIGAPMT